MPESCFSFLNHLLCSALQLVPASTETTKSVNPPVAVDRADKSKSLEHSAASPSLSWRLVRAEGRPAEVVAFEEAVVAFFLESGDILGVPKSVAAIYGICFANAAPLSFTDIVARLDISQGSISQGLRVLREIGALKVVGSYDRREYFSPDVELRKVATHFIENRLEKQLRSGKQRLKALKSSIPKGENGSAKELAARLKYLQSWHDKASTLVPLAKTALKLT